MSCTTKETFQRSKFIDGLCHNEVCACLNLALVFLKLTVCLFIGHIQVERAADMERCLEGMDLLAKNSSQFAQSVFVWCLQWTSTRTNRSCDEDGEPSY